ncbi:MAG: hypothetical protein LIQ31_08315, partial [Planctomycetes bacterium]|nr:hypothetical protein [Planctomycetota bacterium]
YSRAKGLYAGAAFEGGGMFNSDKYTHLFYGREVTLKDIILNKQVHVPPEAIPMIETLRSYAIANKAAPEPYRDAAPIENRTVLDREAAEAARRADMAAEEARRAAAAAEAAAERAARGY